MSGYGTAAVVKVCGCRPHEGGAARTGGPAYANLQRRKPRKMWLGSASGAMGIGTLPVFCRGGLGAFSADDRRRVEAVRPVARGRIGVRRRRWYDTATIVSSATASMVIADR